MSPERNGVRPVTLHAQPSVGDRATGERSTRYNAQIWTGSSSDAAATAPVLGPRQTERENEQAGAGVTRLPAASIKMQPGQARRRLGWG